MASQTRSQPSLFIVAASAPIARRRVDRAVLRGIDASSLAESLKDQADREFTTGHARDGQLHVWSIRDSPRLRSAWASVQPADWLLFYSRGFFTAAGSVGATTDSVSLAREVWGGSADADDYRLMIAFSTVERLDVSAWEYKTYVGGRFLGFRQVASERRAAISRRFGSLDQFIRDGLSSHD